MRNETDKTKRLRGALMWTPRNRTGFDIFGNLNGSRYQVFLAHDGEKSVSRAQVLIASQQLVNQCRYVTDINQAVATDVGADVACESAAAKQVVDKV